jgi:hypothetical protein
LIGAEVASLGISQQTIQTARQMPDMERDWSGSRRPRIHFVIGEIAAPLRQVIIRQLQRVQNGAAY